MLKKYTANAQIDILDLIKTWAHSEKRAAELSVRDRDGVPETVDYHQGRLHTYKRVIQELTERQRALGIPAERVWYQFTDDR